MHALDERLDNDPYPVNAPGLLDGSADGGETEFVNLVSYVPIEPAPINLITFAEFVQKKRYRKRRMRYGVKIQDATQKFAQTKIS